MKINTGKIRVNAVGDPATATHVLIEIITNGVVDSSKEVPVDTILPSKNVGVETTPEQIKRQVILNAYLNGTAGPGPATFVHIHSPQFRTGLNNTNQGFGIQTNQGRATFGDIADQGNSGTYKVPYSLANGASGDLFISADELAQDRSENLLDIVQQLIPAMLMSRNGNVKVDPPSVTVANAARWYPQMSDLVAAHEYYYFG